MKPTRNGEEWDQFTSAAIMSTEQGDIRRFFLYMDRQAGWGVATGEVGTIPVALHGSPLENCLHGRRKRGRGRDQDGWRVESCIACPAVPEAWSPHFLVSFDVHNLYMSPACSLHRRWHGPSSHSCGGASRGRHHGTLVLQHAYMPLQCPSQQRPDDPMLRSR